jgi:hypothetical protein
MAATPSVRILKTTPYKGGLRTWSNRYHFNGGTPADAAHWDTLMDAIVTAEKAILPTNVTIVLGIGYAAGSDVPVRQKVYTTVGTLAFAANGIAVPLGNAALIRYSTAARSTKNHPIYLFNYVHAVGILSTATSKDTLDANQKAAMQTYATHWITGFSDGSITAIRASPNGAAATGSIVEEWVTHRDFPYQSSV